MRFLDLCAHTCEEKGDEGDVLVHGVEGVEGDEAVQEGFTEEGQSVAAHGDNEAGVSEHHSRGCTPGNRNSIPGQPPQAGVLPLHRVI